MFYIRVGFGLGLEFGGGVFVMSSDAALKI